MTKLLGTIKDNPRTQGEKEKYLLVYIRMNHTKAITKSVKCMDP